MEYSTRIDGYTVWLAVGPDATFCHLSKGPLAASLELLDVTGCFEDDEGREVPISNRTLATVRAWAEGKGY